MMRARKAVGTLVAATTLGALLVGVGCSSKTIPAGGVVLAIRTDGSLPQATSLELNVTSPDGKTTYANRTYNLPTEAKLPTTIGIETNGSATSTVTVNASLFAGTTLVDDRLDQVFEIPTDRVTELDIVFSANCTALAVNGATGPTSQCGADGTCNPLTGICGPNSINAGQLMTFDPARDAGALDGSRAQMDSSAFETSDAMTGAQDGESAANDAMSPVDAAVGCEIAGKFYAANAGNPTNVCQSCQPAESATTWSAVTDGSSCTSGGICHAGACASGCEVGGLFFAATDADPSNPCQTCQPNVTTSAFTPVADGGNCGNGQTCSGGECGTQCVINGATIATGTVDSENSCQSCQPGTSTSAWSNVGNGTKCGATNDVCTNGTCGCPLTTCNGVCLDTSTSTANCAACGRACSVSGATSTSCAKSVCTPVCASGHVNCDGSPTADDGCECAGNACCAGNVCQNVHSNGFGQSFYDCSALHTYTSASATEACLAFTGPGGICCQLSATFEVGIVTVANGYFYEWDYTTMGEIMAGGTRSAQATGTSCKNYSPSQNTPAMGTWN